MTSWRRSSFFPSLQTLIANNYKNITKNKTFQLSDEKTLTVEIFLGCSTNSLHNNLRPFCRDVQVSVVIRSIISSHFVEMRKFL